MRGTGAKERAENLRSLLFTKDERRRQRGLSRRRVRISGSGDANRRDRKTSSSSRRFDPRRSTCERTALGFAGKTVHGRFDANESVSHASSGASTALGRSHFSSGTGGFFLSSLSSTERLIYSCALQTAYDYQRRRRNRHGK